MNRSFETLDWLTDNIMAQCCKDGLLTNREEFGVDLWTNSAVDSCGYI